MLSIFGSGIRLQPTLPLRGATVAQGDGRRRLAVSTHAPLAGSDLAVRRLRHQVHHVSTHAPLAGSDGVIPSSYLVKLGFNPRSPCGERRGAARTATRAGRFYPRSPCGERRCSTLGTSPTPSFYPRSPCGERLRVDAAQRLTPLHFSPLLAGATFQLLAVQRGGVSTHAPLAGSDSSVPASACSVKLHAPLRGATTPTDPTAVGTWFQPTPPLRGATPDEPDLLVDPSVSTHAPLAGSDFRPRRRGHRRRCFNPRSPCGERPRRYGRRIRSTGFNPRSPCGERRRSRRTCATSTCAFNPRSPCGERQSLATLISPTPVFQPTLPLRGATERRIARFFQSLGYRFNPRSSCGERHHHVHHRQGRGHVSTHAPLAGSDIMAATGLGCSVEFQPTLPLRGATIS